MGEVPCPPRTFARSVLLLRILLRVKTDVLDGSLNCLMHRRPIVLLPTCGMIHESRLNLQPAAVPSRGGGALRRPRQ